MNTRIHHIAILLATAALLLTGCKKEHVLPRASGRPYEILVVMKRGAWEAPEGRALYNVLDSDIPGLPQPEPSFHISQIDPSHYDQIANIFRNIIVVKIDPTLYSHTSLHFVRDQYALEQIIMTLTSPSANDMADFCFDHGEEIVDFFTKMEMNRLVKNLQGKYSKKVAELAAEYFDCQLHAPDEIQATKRCKDFFWASSNTASGNVNICMYAYPYEGPETFNKTYVLAKRDSFMRENIPGSLPEMYMATDTMYTAVQPIIVHNQYAMETRGLWYMEHGAMGGPFVSHSRVDTTQNRVIVVEGFVFAPEKMKRGLMRRLEGSLYTLNLPDEKTSDIVTTLDEVTVGPEKDAH